MSTSAVWTKKIKTPSCPIAQRSITPRLTLQVVAKWSARTQQTAMALRKSRFRAGSVVSSCVRQPRSSAERAADGWSAGSILHDVGTGSRGVKAPCVVGGLLVATRSAGGDVGPLSVAPRSADGDVAPRSPPSFSASPRGRARFRDCLLYTSDAADDLTRVDLGGRRIIK